MLSPECDTRMCWEAGNDQVMLRISRSLVERTLVGYLGHPLDKPLHFELGFRWRDCAPWSCLLSHLVDCATHYPDLEQHKLVLSQVEQLAASILLTSHLHNYSETAPARSSILPRHVRRAQDYLQAHAHEPLSVEQLAQVAGVSVRSLYSGFKEFLGVSPMHYLRDLRMERARTELLSGEAASVAGVALRWASRIWAVSATTTRPATWKRPARRCGGTESARDSAPEPQAVPAPFPQNGITSLASSWLPSGRLRTSKSFCHFSVNSQPPWLA